MGKITVDLIRKRAEHNEGMISNLEELALHQQHIEKIELLHRVCRHLKILLLQNNLISKIQNLHRLKELHYLNLAINNITKVQNLQRCESLQKLDLTMNFIAKAGLLSLRSLQQNEFLEELYLMGNPCQDWPHWRQYVVATLPRLKKLDGQEVKPSERIAAQQAYHSIQAQLCAELRAEGVDPERAAQVEDDSAEPDLDGEVEDSGYVDENGELRRPWCPATRIIEHRENERLEREQQDKKQAEQTSLMNNGSRTQKPRLDEFPEIRDGEKIFQKNEGSWDFTLDESADQSSIVLDVDVGKYLDTSLIKADVQPRWARLLIKGRLLQLQLPCEVKPDAAVAQRSKITGNLVLTMPKETPDQVVHDVSLLRRRAGSGERPVRKLERSLAENVKISEHARQEKQCSTVDINIVGERKEAKGFVMKAVRKAPVLCCDGSDDDVPPL